MKKILGLLASFLLIFVTSCSLSSTPLVIVVTATVPMESLVAQSVALTIAAQIVPSNPLPNDTPAFSVTPQFTPTLQFTFTPEAPKVMVSVQTNCRSGPGSDYDVLGVMNVGETAEVVGKSLYAGNWIIKLPSNPAITCTLWGQYATVIGDSSSLPVVTPPPTPTPAAFFTAVFSSTCNVGIQYLSIYKLTNTGTVTWESNQITETDLITGVTIVVTQDYSFDYSGCHSNGSFNQSLEPGEVDMFTTDGDWGYNPSGHAIKAVLQLCSQDGLAGICREQTVTYNY